MPEPTLALFRAADPDAGVAMPDLAALATLHAASFVTPPPWSAQDFDATLASRFAFLLAINGAEGVLGFLLGSSVAGEAELLTLAVNPQLRRAGLGRRLVAAFLDEARQSGAESAFLEVSAENPAAIALYETSGFALTGRRKAYYRRPDAAPIDALTMQRPLLP